jgi:DNA-binding LacI/PurR family transcriptional regulator
VAAVDRTAGWRAALAEKNLADDLLARGDFSQASGEKAMLELLQREPHLDAVFVQNDLMALGAITALRNNRKDVPGDVSVMGFDDSVAATSGLVPLTTVRQPSFEMGNRMANMLVSILTGVATPPAVLMETSIIVRDSA